MIKCIELGQSFETKHEMFKALAENEKAILHLKKSTIFKSAEKGQCSVSGAYIRLDEEKMKANDFKEEYVYPVINTTYFRDSHKDVHINGIWNKTLKEQRKNIFYVDGHSLKTDDVIAWKEDVRAYTKMLDWDMVGKNYKGQTQALIYEIAKEKLEKESAIKAIEKKRPVENSVRMMYVKVKMAINDDGEDFKEYKATFDKYYPAIVNKEDVDEDDYFYAILEAKIVTEGSMVLAGSNSATPIIQLEAAKVKSTPSKQEAAQKALQDEQKQFIKSLNR